MKIHASVSADSLIETWMQAARLRRAVEAQLRPSKLSFALWWVLYVTDRLIREVDDAVSQQAVAERTELDKNTVSYLMTGLARRGLVDRGPDAFNWMYRIWVTEKGSALLVTSRCAVERALEGET